MPRPSDTSLGLQPAGFDDLAGFASDGLAAAFACFRLSAEAIVSGVPALRPALPAFPGLHRTADAALACPPAVTDAEARKFFERHFEPAWVVPRAGDAFYTGYYEPVVDGAATPGPAFTAPLLARPADLRTFAADESRPTWAANLWSARVTEGDGLEPCPDRAAIEAAIPGEYRAVVWLRDWVEAFLIHVQGSARVRLEDGRLLRLTYAGRNGHPYTSIGRLLVERGDIPPGSMSLDRLKEWLREQGQRPGDPGRALMDRNASFIFFEAEPAIGDEGPTGGASVPLTALRSIAVDRSVWCYGLPFWVEAAIPWQGREPMPFHRLMVAQDTGSAIVGPARVDLFFGSGPEAGRRAGDVRHPGRLAVLRPRAAGAAT